MSYLKDCYCSSCTAYRNKEKKTVKKKSLTTKKTYVNMSSMEGKVFMNVKSFINDLERHVKDVSEDNDNWNQNCRKISGYDTGVFKELEKYLKDGNQSSYADKYFSRRCAELFCCDDYQIDDYLDEIEAKFSKLWKEHASEKGSDESRSNKMSKSDNNESLMSRVFSTAADDGVEIATRIAAKQLSRAVSEPVTAMLIAGLELEDNDSVRGKIAKFLNSDIGLGLVSFALSFGVEQLPLPALAQGVVKNLGRELRLQGEMAVADPVVEIVGAPLRAMLTEKVLALPLPGLAKQLTTGKTETIEAEMVEVEVKKTTTKKPAVKKAVKAAKKTAAKKPAKKENLDIKVKVKETAAKIYENKAEAREANQV